MKIITLCGSSKFKKEFEEENKRLTLNNNIVISLSFFEHSGDKISIGEKIILSEIHLEKIKISDEIYIINVNGYIGKSTQKEIDYAKSLNKKIRYFSIDDLG